MKLANGSLEITLILPMRLDYFKINSRSLLHLSKRASPMAAPKSINRRSISPIQHLDSRLVLVMLLLCHSTQFKIIDYFNVMQLYKLIWSSVIFPSLLIGSFFFLSTSIGFLVIFLFIICFLFVIVFSIVVFLLSYSKINVMFLSCLVPDLVCIKE